MNLVDLILTVCLVASANTCRTEHIYFEHTGSMTQCMLRAPTYIAQWADDHPEFRVVRWRCATPGTDVDI